MTIAKTAAAMDGNEELQLPHESRYKELTEKKTKSSKRKLNESNKVYYFCTPIYPIYIANYFR